MQHKFSPKQRLWQGPKKREIYVPDSVVDKDAPRRRTLREPAAALPAERRHRVETPLRLSLKHRSLEVQMRPLLEAAWTGKHHVVGVAPALCIGGFPREASLEFAGEVAHGDKLALLHCTFFEGHFTALRRESISGGDGLEK